MAKTPQKEPLPEVAKTEPKNEPEVVAKSAEDDVIRDPAGQRLHEFVETVRANREAAEKRAEPKPQGPTERMRTQIELEMEAGRKRSEFFAEQQKNRPQPAPDKGEGTTTPVFRPRDHVPNLNSKDLGARTINA